MLLAWTRKRKRACLTSTVSSKPIFRSFDSKIYPIGVYGDDEETSKHVAGDEGRRYQEIATIPLAENRTLTTGQGGNLEYNGLNGEDIEVYGYNGVNDDQEMAAILLDKDRMRNTDPGTNLGSSGVNIQAGTSRPNDEDIEMRSGDVEKEQQNSGGKEKEAEEQVGIEDGLGESVGNNRANRGGGGGGIQVKVCGPNDGHVDEEQAVAGDVENREQIDKDRGKKAKERTVEKGDPSEINAGRRYPKREVREKVATPAMPSFTPKPRKAAPPKYTTKIRAPRAATWPRDGDVFGQPIDLSVSVFFLWSYISNAVPKAG